MDRMQKAAQLLDLYQKLYKEIYNVPASLNRYKMKWAAADVIDSVGYDRTKILLEYFLGLNRTSHSFEWFCYHFEELDRAFTEKTEDRQRRERLREETKRRVQEIGKQ